MLKIPLLRTLKRYVKESLYKKQILKSNWYFSPNRIEMIIAETQDWEKAYTPIDLKDKVILDIGAGQGETAKFFIEKGAKKVICIESEYELFEYLRENSQIHKEIIPINGYFSIGDLFRFKYDFAKIDIEGYEEQILGWKLLKPTIIEVHGLQLIERFQKEGYLLTKNTINNCLCYAYWQCKPTGDKQ